MKNLDSIIDPPLVETFLLFVFHTTSVLIQDPKMETAKSKVVYNITIFRNIQQ